MRTRVKICGITRPKDAIAAIDAGADAIGLVFYAPSPRAVTVDQAKEITRLLPPFVTTVGLFVDADREEIRRVLDEVPLGLLQFHGDEPPGDCLAYEMPYIKAVRMREGTDIAEFATKHHDASGFLLDSYQPGVPGGTGMVFDWTTVPAQFNKPLILAGGLTAGNVGQAIKQTRPFAVDVSGGVEESKGIKSAEKIFAFMKEVDKSKSE